MNSVNDTSATYLLNTRSKKVHSISCGVGKRSKEKNKQLRKDSLTNIVKDGYKICGDCNAGIKKNFITNIKSLFDDPINVDYDDIELPTREEYLKAVEDVGEWYVNHIPTYCRRLQEETKDEYNGIEKYVDKINLKTKDRLFNNTNEYNYLSNNSSSVTIDDLNINDKVLKANENAVYNYKNNYNVIDVTGGILQYPCEFISESPKYNKAGDDCVRYVFTVLNSIDPQFVERIAKTYSTTWSKVGTVLFNKDDKKFTETMLKNGFNIYATKGKTTDNRIKEIDASFKLEKGDIICRDGHIHIYIGDNETTNFGWGKVNRYFPANYRFSIDNDKYVVKMDKDNDVEFYTKVFRYVGGIK